MFLRGTLQAQRAEDWCWHCRPKFPTRLPTGWHRRCWTLFRVQRGPLLTSLRQRVRTNRDEKPRVWIRILLPRPGAPAKGHYRPKEPRTGVPRRGHCRPKNVKRGYRRVGTVGCCHFRAQLERILALFRQRAKKDPRRGTTGWDSRRAPEAWCSRTGTLQAQIRTPLTLLSNTPQTWCYSGSPHPTFHRGPLRRLPWTRCHILARSST